MSFKSTTTAAFVACTLAACGGGSSIAVPAVAVATVSGTAATGAAISGGTVTLQCVSGLSGASSTGFDGSFSINAGGITFPCVARVEYKDAAGIAQKLHSFVSSAGNANITPVTELMVASLTAGDAAVAFDKFDATKAKAFTPAQIKTAADTVKTYLKTVGVDTTNLPDDPIGIKFVPKNGSTAGDAFDKVLDDVKVKLATAGLSVSAAAIKIVSGNSSAGTTVTVTAPTLATGQLAATGILTGLPSNLSFTARAVTVNPLFTTSGARTTQDASFVITNTDSSISMSVFGDVVAGVGGSQALSINLQTAVVGNKFDDVYEWNAGLCYDSVYPANCKPLAGVTIDRAGKKITFTNAVLDFPNGNKAVAFGKLTLNGTISWQ